MAPATAAATAALTSVTVPEEVRAKFPDLVEMILASRSMNNEERQYWIDVLPIMSEDQVSNLRSILTNEQRQIQEAEASYSKGVSGAVKKAKADFDSEAYREKKRVRLEAERLAEHQEKSEEEALLAQLDQM